MPYKTVTPAEAHARMSARAVYLDVRTEQEFDAGHPVGAINVPAFLAGPGGMTANPDFTAIVGRHWSPETELLLGCASGQRSARACEALAAAGYRNLSNVAGGFASPTGWRAAGLPSDQSPSAWRTL